MDITKETEFSDANECFEAAFAKLKRIGKGSVVHHPVINEPDFLNDPKTGLKYVSKCEGELTKNHRGNDRESTSGVMPEFPGSPYCPVKPFEKYISKLHPLCTSLWQRPKESFSDDDSVWYCNFRLGEKTLAKFMTKLSEGAKHSQTYTNHSFCVTGATILTQSMFNPSQIMAVTGHKSVQSLTVFRELILNRKLQWVMQWEKV
ncbi:KCTD1_15 [Mytilus coruscus]|uniref:KCTD1_15 n=1 Tax=Mytilus coruscus TaxID=42192 RepID=A0A6J8D8S0_MYTCO|nr:KCTD1_15 [Mytilus coruscus]